MATLHAVEIALPEALECDKYRIYNPDLFELPDELLAKHYQQHGESEGRRSNSLETRGQFAALVPTTAAALEIGPFCSPLLPNASTKYFDILSSPALRERANFLGLSAAAVPEIDFVSGKSDLSIVDENFDCVLSSHSLEHQPDLITHLRDVERLLRPGGYYFVLVPDKRYCFDHFLPESTLADVLEAHREMRNVHSFKNVFAHRVLTTHNDTGRHWRNDHGIFMEQYEIRVKAALEEICAADGAYIDVHAWFFTPKSAANVVTALTSLNYTKLRLERMYATRLDSNEFWMVLRK